MCRCCKTKMRVQDRLTIVCSFKPEIWCSARPNVWYSNMTCWVHRNESLEFQVLLADGIEQRPVQHLHGSKPRLCWQSFQYVVCYYGDHGDNHCHSDQTENCCLCNFASNLFSLIRIYFALSIAFNFISILTLSLFHRLSLGIFVSLFSHRQSFEIVSVWVKVKFFSPWWE